jgi:hypothetical protein
MKGFTDPERSLVLLLLEANGGPLRRPVARDELNVAGGLKLRGVLTVSPLPCKCGRHRTVMVTALGREVEQYDRAAREPGLVTP